jgi:hypothetical protein
MWGIIIVRRVPIKDEPKNIDKPRNFRKIREKPQYRVSVDFFCFFKLNSSVKASPKTSTQCKQKIRLVLQDKIRITGKPSEFFCLNFDNVFQAICIFCAFVGSYLVLYRMIFSSFES